jgi:hypothetical protein
LSGIEGIPLAAGCSELDIARLIRFAILVSASNDEIVSLFGKLHNMQHEDGSWRSIGRTAYIVINLLDCYEALAKAMTTDTELNEVIYNAILYLRAAYDEATGTWDRDIQATAKAAHAIGMHNRRFAYSTQDFFETIRREVRQVDRSEGVREMRRELAELRELAKSCRESARTAVAEREATMQSVELFRSDERRLARYETIWRVIATTSSLLLAGLVVSLFVHQFQVAISLFSEIGSLLPLIISAVLAVPITIAMQPRKFTARHKIAGKQES